MKMWFGLYGECTGSVTPGDSRKALDAYVRRHVSFVRIHPFFDGNGRLARLISNIPVLKAGLPPIIIPREQRRQYTDALSEYHAAAGQIQKGGDLLSCPDALKPFAAFCEQAWDASLSLVAEIRQMQEKRDKQT